MNTPRDPEPVAGSRTRLWGRTPSNLSVSVKPPPRPTRGRLPSVANAWSTSKPPMFLARIGAAARTIDGKIYVAGGLMGSPQLTPATEVYDPALDE